MSKKIKDIVKRYPGNPVLVADDVPYQTPYTFNAAACKFDGKYLSHTLLWVNSRW